MLHTIKLLNWIIPLFCNKKAVVYKKISEQKYSKWEKIAIKNYSNSDIYGKKIKLDKNKSKTKEKEIEEKTESSRNIKSIRIFYQAIMVSI